MSKLSIREEVGIIKSDKFQNLQAMKRVFEPKKKYIHLSREGLGTSIAQGRADDALRVWNSNPLG